MDVLSLISTKGGAGKTTVAANLGGVLADAGLRVLLLDLDSQPTLSSYYTMSEAREAGSYELIAQRLTAPDQVISATVIQHLDLIVSNDRAGHMSTLPLHAADGRLRLRNLLPAFEEHYDVLIIDTPRRTQRGRGDGHPCLLLRAVPSPAGNARRTGAAQGYAGSVRRVGTLPLPGR